MVFLAITRAGYEAYRAHGVLSGALWIGAKVVSEEELSALRKSGVVVTNFNYTIEFHEAEVIAGAVETIKEHHPVETVRVEV